MRALVQLAFGDKVPDCTKCGGEPRLRSTYGCDAPAVVECSCHGREPACACKGSGLRPFPVFHISCGSCHGAGCDECDEGAVPMYRCPAKLVDSYRDGRSIRTAFWYCMEYENSKVLPTAGGVADQSAQFVQSLRVFSSELGHIRKDQAEQAERDRIRSEARSRRG